MRDSSIRFRRTAESLTYATLNGMTKVGDSPVYNTTDYMTQNPWKMDISTTNGSSQEDISWVL